MWNTTGKDDWTCCGDYDCGLGGLTTRMFDAAPPTHWKEFPHSSGGLSHAAIIGIAVAAAVVGVAIIGGLVGFFIRRKRQSGKQPAFGRTAKKRYEQIGPQGDISMAAPFVQAENQAYSRPHSPDPSQLNAGYYDRRRSSSNPPPHQPPTD